MGLQGKRIPVGDLSFHVVDEGAGPAVLLLHGFPDSWFLWRHQIPALKGASFRVIAPDLRGFGKSDKPAEVEAYALPLILKDVTGILDALGVERAHVVGHDWGAVVGWLLAAYHPARVVSLAALSVGHPSAYRNPTTEQREKSWYILFFQFEEIAEEALRRDDWQLLRQWSGHHSELATWIPDLSRPEALTAALNWYRANAHPGRSVANAPHAPLIQAPTLGVWSAGDAHLTEKPMQDSHQFVAGPWRYARIDNASHWLQLDQPDVITRLLLGFLPK